jgi:TRAP-type C4-dicarboxylate transport system substrate-binding protein
MFRPAVLKILGVALVGFAFSSAPSATAQEVTLRLHHFIPPVAAPHKHFLTPWADKVMKESGGRLKIEIYPSMGLGGRPPQLYDQVKDGIVDIIFTLPGYTPGRFPKTEAFELPFMHVDAVTTNRAMQDYFEKHLQDEYKDVHVLLLHVHEGQVFHTRTPIRKFDDFKGKTFRTPSSAGTLLIEALGANAYHSPVTEMAQLLSKGVVDGVMVPFEIVPAFKVHQLVKYHVTVQGPRVHTSAFLFAMNKNSYAKLPADLKKVIDNNSRRNLADFAGKVWIDIEKPGIALSKKRGNEFITLSAEETAKVREAGMKARQRWVEQVKDKGIDGAALLKDAEAMLAKHKGKM